MSNSNRPFNPIPPTPEFVTAEIIGKPNLTVYGWKCLAHGILAYGNTAVEAQDTWLNNYQAEYLN